MADITSSRLLVLPAPATVPAIDAANLEADNARQQPRNSRANAEATAALPFVLLVQVPAPAAFFLTMGRFGPRRPLKEEDRVRAAGGRWSWSFSSSKLLLPLAAEVHLLLLPDIVVLPQTLLPPSNSSSPADVVEDVDPALQALPRTARCGGDGDSSPSPPPPQVADPPPIFFRGLFRRESWIGVMMNAAAAAAAVPGAAGWWTGV